MEKTDTSSSSAKADAHPGKVRKPWGQFNLSYIFLKAILNPFRKRQGRGGLIDRDVTMNQQRELGKQG
jgi:hypothetical protein